VIVDRMCYKQDCWARVGPLVLQLGVSTFHEYRFAQTVMLNQPEISPMSNRIYFAVNQ
jgi:hypothetical protein